MDMLRVMCTSMYDIMVAPVAVSMRRINITGIMRHAAIDPHTTITVARDFLQHVIMNISGTPVAVSENRMT